MTQGWESLPGRRRASVGLLAVFLLWFGTFDGKELSASSMGCLPWFLSLASNKPGVVAHACSTGPLELRIMCSRSPLVILA